tara:strand:- start:191 stop:430 length:240 start_codon:yes stop_codon:yes gene_type:complete
MVDSLKEGKTMTKEVKFLNKEKTIISGDFLFPECSSFLFRAPIEQTEKTIYLTEKQMEEKFGKNWDIREIPSCFVLKDD